MMWMACFVTSSAIACRFGDGQSLLICYGPILNDFGPFQCELPSECFMYV
jgi:hypothetical protein